MEGHRSMKIPRELRVGDRLPLPEKKLVVLPSRHADVGGKSLRGAFCNGRGGK